MISLSKSIHPIFRFQAEVICLSELIHLSFLLNTSSTPMQFKSATNSVQGMLLLQVSDAT